MLFKAIKHHLLSSTERRFADRQQVANVGDYLIYQPQLPTALQPTGSELSLDTTYVTVTMIVRLMAKHPGGVIDVVRLGLVPVLPRSLMRAWRPWDEDDIDWAKLEDVRWLCDRSTGLTTAQKRELEELLGNTPDRSSSGSGSHVRRSGSDVAQLSARGVAAMQRVAGWNGPSDLPLQRTTLRHLSHNNLRVLPSHDGLFNSLRKGHWILYRGTEVLRWGRVLKVQATRQGRQLKVLGLDAEAGLESFAIGTGTMPLPNLARIMREVAEQNERSGTRHRSAREGLINAVEVYISITQVRGIVAPKYLADTEYKPFIGRPLHAPLARWDYVSVTDRHGRSFLGWITGSVKSITPGYFVWKERSAMDFWAPSASIILANSVRVRKDDVERVVVQASIALRPLSPGTEVYVIRRRRRDGRAIVESGIVAPWTIPNISLRHAASQFYRTNPQIPVIINIQNELHRVYYERRNVFVVREDAKRRLDRLQGFIRDGYTFHAEEQAEMMQRRAHSSRGSRGSTGSTVTVES